MDVFCIRVCIKDNSFETHEKRRRRQKEQRVCKGGGIACEGGRGEKGDRKVRGIKRGREEWVSVRITRRGNRENTEEDISPWQSEQPYHSEAVNLLAILRVLLGLRKCGFSQGGSSEPALSQQSHSETFTCQSDVGRVGRPEADGRRGVSGPAWGMLGNSLLLPSFLKLMRVPSTPDTWGPTGRRSCITRSSLGPGLRSVFPSPLCARSCRWQPRCASVSSSVDWHGKNTHIISSREEEMNVQICPRPESSQQLVALVVLVVLLGEPPPLLPTAKASVMEQGSWTVNPRADYALNTWCLKSREAKSECLGKDDGGERLYSLR